MFKTKKQKEALKAQHRLLEAYKAVFGSDQGRLVLQDILGTAGFFSPTAPDGHLAHHNGMRSVAIDILNKTKIAENFELMAELADAAYRQHEEDDE